MPGDKTAKPVQDRTNWAALRTLSEDEIERLADTDEDNPATVDEGEWAHATIGLPPAKTAIHATFDRDVVEFFKRDGRGYSSRMNAVLRRYMESEQAKKAGG